MSVESISNVLNSDLTVSPTAKLVLVGIANHDGDGGAWPSVATLARYAGVSTRSVQYRLTELTEAGLIVVHKNAGGTSRTPGHSRPNLYEITLAPGETSCTPPGETDCTTPPATDCTTPLQPVAPEPSLNTSIEPSVEPPTFDTFYAAFPKNSERADAKRRWAQMNAADKQAAFDYMPALNEWVHNNPDGNTYLTNASSWLRRRKWEDDLDPYNQPNSRAARNAAVFRTVASQEAEKRTSLLRKEIAE